MRHLTTVLLKPSLVQPSGSHLCARHDRSDHAPKRVRESGEALEGEELDVLRLRRPRRARARRRARGPVGPERVIHVCAGTARVRVENDVLPTPLPELELEGVAPAVLDDAADER